MRLLGGTLLVIENLPIHQEGIVVRVVNIDECHDVILTQRIHRTSSAATHLHRLVSGQQCLERLMEFRCGGRDLQSADRYAADQIFAQPLAALYSGRASCWLPRDIRTPYPFHRALYR